jgi:molecular chaperone DnaJ
MFHSNIFKNFINNNNNHTNSSFNIPFDIPFVFETYNNIPPSPIVNTNNKKDLYNILNITKESTKNEIKKSYHKLAKEYHPDKQNGSDEKFKELNEAYNILSDDDKRYNYDNNINFPDLSEFNQYSFNTDEIFKEFNDIFDVFHQKYKTNQNSVNKSSTKNEQNISIKVNIDEIILGSIRKISYIRDELCSLCEGTCAYHPNDIVKCVNCMPELNNLSFIKLTPNPNCKSCLGKGILLKTERRCKECTNGVVKKNITIQLKIPKGLPNNFLVLLKNKGNYNLLNKEFDNLRIKIVHNFDNNIEIKDLDLIYNLEISLKELFNGFEKEINILETKKHKNYNFKLIKNDYFDPNELIIYKNRGIVNYKKLNEIGDLIIKFKIIYPDSNNKNLIKYKKVFKELFNKF